MSIDNPIPRRGVMAGAAATLLASTRAMADLGEERVLALAHAYQKATPWYRREPPIA